MEKQWPLVLRVFKCEFIKDDEAGIAVSSHPMCLRGQNFSSFPNVSNNLLKTLINSKNIFINHGNFKGFEIKHLISVMMFKYGNALCSALRTGKDGGFCFFLQQGLCLHNCTGTFNKNKYSSASSHTNPQQNLLLEHTNEYCCKSDWAGNTGPFAPLSGRSSSLVSQDYARRAWKGEGSLPRSSEEENRRLLGSGQFPCGFTFLSLKLRKKTNVWYSRRCCGIQSFRRDLRFSN